MSAFLFTANKAQVNSVQHYYIRVFVLNPGEQQIITFYKLACISYGSTYLSYIF